jgi:hypothetical protein
MDTAVGLVQTYLRVNGYFTVAEYPIVEYRGGYAPATDVDVLAFRFPGVASVIPGEVKAPHHPPFTPDAHLQVPAERADMVVAEVKEGAAEFNRSGRRKDVLAAALARFGCCPPEGAHAAVEELLGTGRATMPHDHDIRLIAFGGTVDAAGSHPYRRITLGHVLRYLEDWVGDHWEVLRHNPSKDPTLAFLITLRKARGGDPENI